ncbi:MAG: DUF2807 domain-containing protein [Acidobacteria bacterium]|nr:MAG: DUF2807 domain-containing protein [Acidobacteriota bacterium]
MKQLSMKPFLLLLCFALTAPVAFAETRDLHFTGFTGVSVGWGIEVDITQGPDHRVQVIGDSRDLDELKVEKEGDVLVFSHESRRGWRRHDKLRVNIVMPTLKSLDLSGGVEGQLSMDAGSETFSGELSGGSELNGQLRCGDLKLSLSGGAELHLAGQGGNVYIDGSGGAECDLKEFKVADVTSELSGGSTATVNMNGVLNANQSGGSQIIYFGSATVGRSSSSGGSGIRKGN